MIQVPGIYHFRAQATISTNVIVGAQLIVELTFMTGATGHTIPGTIVRRNVTAPINFSESYVFPMFVEWTVGLEAGDTVQIVLRNLGLVPVVLTDLFQDSTEILTWVTAERAAPLP